MGTQPSRRIAASAISSRLCACTHEDEQYRNSSRSKGAPRITPAHEWHVLPARIAASSAAALAFSAASSSFAAALASLSFSFFRRRCLAFFSRSCARAVGVVVVVAAVLVGEV